MKGRKNQRGNKEMGERKFMRNGDDVIYEKELGLGKQKEDM